MSAGTGERPPYLQRLTSLRESFADAGIDGLLVTHPPNLRYLVGFEGSAGALLVSAADAILIVDGRYFTTAQALASGDEQLSAVRVELADQAIEQAVARVTVAGPRLWNLGLEAAAMTLSRYDALAEALGRAEALAGPAAAAPRLRTTERLVEARRLVKDAAEIARLREAGTRLSAVARLAFEFVQAGRSEREIAADIDREIRRAGFERPAFETIVASGPNSALPHARPTDRTLADGDGVVLDFGGVYDGYCVDLTRTVQLGRQTVEFRRLFDAVRAAHDAACRAVGPGVLASAVDGSARRELVNRGLGDAFVHGTGHGLGLEVHEEPRIRKGDPAQRDEVLQPGMVFTIEPGAYVPGIGGVRIEDDVLVVETGCELLTHVPIDRP